MSPMINSRSALYCVIGNPISHSLSPLLQNKAFEISGINGCFISLKVEKTDSDFKKAFQLFNIQGFNITAPHKESIISLLDELDESASSVGSVNTVKVENDKWIGYSTDGRGFVKGLSLHGLTLKNKTVQIIGAGGSSKSVCYSILSEQPRALFIWNRTSEKSDDLIRQLKKSFPHIPIYSGFTDEKTDLLVNTTTVGNDGSSLPCDLSVIDRTSFVSDLLYNPVKTPMIFEAEKRGIPFNNGLDMLIAQGMFAFEIWTGHKFDFSRDLPLIDSHVRKAAN